MLLENIKSVKFFWQKLAISNKPSGLPYFRVNLKRDLKLINSYFIYIYFPQKICSFFLQQVKMYLLNFWICVNIHFKKYPQKEKSFLAKREIEKFSPKRKKKPKKKKYRSRFSFNLSKMQKSSSRIAKVKRNRMKGKKTNIFHDDLFKNIAIWINKPNNLNKSEKFFNSPLKKTFRRKEKIITRFLEMNLSCLRFRSGNYSREEMGAGGRKGKKGRKYDKTGR